MNKETTKFFFPDSKCLDRLTPVILSISSDKVAAPAYVLAFLLIVGSYWLLPLLALVIFLLYGSYEVITWLLRVYLLERLLVKRDQEDLL